MGFDRELSSIDDTRQRVEVVTTLYLSLQQAAKRLPPGRNGRPVHVSTIIRWITQGARSPSGEIVRLQAVRLGSRWLTSAEFLDDFARRLTPSFGEPSASSIAPARRKDLGKVGELDAAGI